MCEQVPILTPKALKHEILSFNVGDRYGTSMCYTSVHSSSRLLLTTELVQAYAFRLAQVQLVAPTTIILLTQQYMSKHHWLLQFLIYM